MSRNITSLFILTGALTVSANAAPVSGGSLVPVPSIKTNSAAVFSSSLSGANANESHAPVGSMNYGGGAIGALSFAMVVPPPVISETPEPSTLALFGTGLMMMGGAVRRKFRR